MSDEANKPDLRPEARIACIFETLAAAEPALIAELIELLRGVDIVTFRKLFGQQDDSAPALELESDRTFGASSKQSDAPTLEPESGDPADRFRRRPLLEGNTAWSA